MEKLIERVVYEIAIQYVPKSKLIGIETLQQALERIQPRHPEQYEGQVNDLIDKIRKLSQ